jgi:hypothetical protein
MITSTRERPTGGRGSSESLAASIGMGWGSLRSGSRGDSSSGKARPVAVAGEQGVFFYGRLSRPARSVGDQPPGERGPFLYELVLLALDSCKSTRITRAEGTNISGTTTIRLMTAGTAKDGLARAAAGMRTASRAKRSLFPPFVHEGMVGPHVNDCAYQKFLFFLDNALSYGMSHRNTRGAASYQRAKIRCSLALRRRSPSASIRP